MRSQSVNWNKPSRQSMRTHTGSGPIDLPRVAGERAAQRFQPSRSYTAPLNVVVPTGTDSG
jgi:hypothetical protein